LYAETAEQGLELAEFVLPNLVVVHTHKSDSDAMTGLADKLRQHEALGNVPVIVLHDVENAGDPAAVDLLIKQQSAG